MGREKLRKECLAKSGREIRKNNLVDVIKVYFIHKYKIIIVNTFLSFKKSLSLSIHNIRFINTLLKDSYGPTLPEDLNTIKVDGLHQSGFMEYSTNSNWY